MKKNYRINIIKGQHISFVDMETTYTKILIAAIRRYNTDPAILNIAVFNLKNTCFEIKKYDSPFHHSG